MVQWYGIKIDSNNLPMCTDLYMRLKDVLNCEGLSESSLEGIIKKRYVGDAITDLYVQVVKDFMGWRYMGLFAFESSLRDQAIVLTVNEFYGRFLQHTVTL